MGKKLATNFLAFDIKMTPSAVLVLRRGGNCTAKLLGEIDRPFFSLNFIS